MTHPQAYSTVAIILHWGIALGIMSLITLGLVMENVKDPLLKFELYQWHKSVGILVLLASLVRLGWRLTHRVPALPVHFHPAEKVIAHAVHVAFYGLMILIPLTGWAMVSVSAYNLPTVLFGVIPWPHLPVIPHLHNKEMLEVFFAQSHELLAKLAIGLIILHIGAAVKHQLVAGENILARMLPVLRSKR